LAQNRYLGWWLQETNISQPTYANGYNSGGTHPASLFFNTMFLTPPYPSTVEIMIFALVDDEANGILPTASNSKTQASIAFWKDLATLADAYPNIRLFFQIAFDPTNFSGAYGLSGFQLIASALATHKSVYSIGVEGEYTKPASSLTLSMMTTLLNYVNGLGKVFCSYYVSTSVIPAGGYYIGHTNFPGGDSGGYDQVGTLTMYTASPSIGLDSGYYANFPFPSTVTCPIGASAMNSSTAGWNQCVVSTELSTAVAQPLSGRTYLQIDTGFTSSGSFTGVSGLTTTQLWDSPTIRNWVWTDPNYQPNFILSTSAVGPTLTVTVNASPASGNAPLSVNFTSTVSGGKTPYTYSWAFGDGGTSTSANPSHTFAAAGTYNVLLTVQDSSSPVGNGSGTTSVTVSSSSTLTCAITATPNSGTVPLTVNFTSAVNGGTTPYSYTWTFGDGGTSNSSSANHTYPVSGTYTVQLTVTDSSSPVKTANASTTITANPSVMTVAITPSPVSGTAPLNVNFTSSVSGGVAPFYYAWSFGDGNLSVLPNPTNLYSVGGNYTATLSLTDSASNHATNSVVIPVAAKPRPATGINCFGDN